MGIQTVTFRFAAQRPESGDFLTVMRENAQRLRAAVAAKAQ
jgi:hypothetical protein